MEDIDHNLEPWVAEFAIAFADEISDLGCTCRHQFNATTVEDLLNWSYVNYQVKLPNLYGINAGFSITNISLVIYFFNREQVFELCNPKVSPKFVIAELMRLHTIWVSAFEEGAHGEWDKHTKHLRS